MRDVTKVPCQTETRDVAGHGRHLNPKTTGVPQLDLSAWEQLCVNKIPMQCHWEVENQGDIVTFAHHNHMINLHL